jgi:hypothetical protein
MDKVIHSKAIDIQDILKEPFPIFSAACQLKKEKDMLFGDIWSNSSAAIDECILMMKKLVAALNRIVEIR